MIYMMDTLHTTTFYVCNMLIVFLLRADMSLTFDPKQKYDKNSPTVYIETVMCCY